MTTAARVIHFCGGVCFHKIIIFAALKIYDMKEIYINVENENDIYNTFGGPGELNDEFVDYVIGKLKESEILEPVQLVFQSPEPMNEQRVRDSLSMWIKKERHELQREERANKLHQLWLVIIGVVFVAISIAVELLVSEFSFTILSTIGAFALWEAANVWIVENPQLRLRRLLVKHMNNNYTVIFKTLNGDA